jgi:HEAT repeat protein
MQRQDTAGSATDAGEIPVPEVEALLATLVKALRAFQMYQANNPVFHRFRLALSEAFERLWERVDVLELTVQEEGFGYGDRLFPLGRGRDSLAFAFHKDGIRYLRFHPGFEEEAGEFLEAVNRARGRDDGGDDLVAVLWERDFNCLEYGYLDLLAEGVPVPDGPARVPEALDGLLLQGELEEASSVRDVDAPSGVVGLTREDFDETLYFLDQGEMAVLRAEIQVEMERDLRKDVLNALFDRLEDPGRERQRLEVMDILDQLMPLFLSQGDLLHATRILEELDRLVSGETPVDDALAARVESLFSRLGEPAVLEQFVQALEDGAVSPDSGDVTLFFRQLKGPALPVLIRFAETSDVPAVRARLASAIDGLAGRHPLAIEKLLKDDDAVLVKGAARSAGRVGLAPAVRWLGPLLNVPDGEVRLAAAEALVAIRTAPALHALIGSLEDEDRDVRLTAARAMGALRFASAREALARALGGRRLREADVTEKMVFFEAYGAAGGAAAVERLARMLNDRGFLGRRPPTELRACAALGLGRAGTAAAVEALERARSDEDGVVRNAVLRALRSEAMAS